MWSYDFADMSDLLGKTLVRVDRGDDVIEFETSEGVVYRMEHHQDCCESVYIEDIIGDLSDLIGSPILRSEEVSNHNEAPPRGYEPESYTWTFYKIDTMNGGVTIRWFGSSNGYYGESAGLYRMK